jgi:gluconolactonase
MASAVWDVTKSLPRSSLTQITDFAPFIHGLDHPEGVACGPKGELYAGGEAGQIYRVELDGTHGEVGTTGGFVLGLCLDADANIYACDLAKHNVAKITPGGEVCVYSHGAPNRPMVTPNYPVFDATGNLYVSDSGGWHEHNGCVFRVRPGGETDVLSEEIVDFPNGMALHPDGTHLYMVVSQADPPGVVRIALNGDGSTGSPEIVAELPQNVPDGVAFDEERNLYIACYTPDVIYRVTPDGRLDVLASDWESVTFATPTNIAFCGQDRRILVVASLSRWHLTKGEMPIPGARLQYPRLEDTAMGEG